MKCACLVCGKHIDYEMSSAGAKIACPHCGSETRLATFSPAPPPIPQATAVQPARRRSTAWIVVAVIAVAIVPVMLIVGLLAAIAIPNFVKARQSSQRAACVANLKMIDGAKVTWALEHKKLPSDEPGEDELFGSERYVKAKPMCPGNGFYSINPVREKPTCSVPGHSL